MLLQSEKICYHVLERQYNREKAAAVVIAIIIKNDWPTFQCVRSSVDVRSLSVKNTFYFIFKKRNHGSLEAGIIFFFLGRHAVRHQHDFCWQTCSTRAIHFKFLNPLEFWNDEAFSWKGILEMIRHGGRKMDLFFRPTCCQIPLISYVIAIKLDLV